MNRLLVWIIVSVAVWLTTAIFAVGTSAAHVSPAQPIAPEQLVVGDTLMVTTGSTVTVPIHYFPVVDNVVGLAFSIDFDEQCLTFDPTDADKSGLPDTIHIYASPAFNRIFFDDLGDIDGELDFILIDFMEPYLPLPQLEPLLSITFVATCDLAPGTSIDAHIAFSQQPSPTYTTTNGEIAVATSRNGSVRILSNQPTPTPTPTSTLISAPTPTVTTTPIAMQTATPTATGTATAISATSTPTATPTFVPTAQPQTIVDEFTALYQENGIVLQWHTSYEANTKMFSIHRITLGQDNTFSPIGQEIAGQGIQGGSYSVTDEQIDQGLVYTYLLVEQKQNGVSVPYYDLLLTVEPTSPTNTFQIRIPIVMR